MDITGLIDYFGSQPERKFDGIKKAKKITPSILMNWETRNEEDVIVDGPYEVDEDMLCEELNKNTELVEYLKKTGSIEDEITSHYDISLPNNGGMTDEEEKHVLKLQKSVHKVIAKLINDGYGEWNG